jgi:predicted component of type VI protein secretion system
MPCLVLKGEVHELGDGETIVGTGAKADWRVADADLMPKHFVLNVRGSKASVERSTPDAVVAVNGKQVQLDGRELEDGDVVAAGSGRFVYWTTEPKVEPEPASSVLLEQRPVYLVDHASAVAYRITQVSTGIGRDHSNIVILPDPTVSRFHADIRREAGGHVLRTVGSAGTRLNTQPMKAPALLSEGDEIRIQQTTLRFTGDALPANVRVAAPWERPTSSGTRVETTKVSPMAGPADAGRNTRSGMAGRPRATARAVILGVVIVVLVGIGAWMLLA